VALAEELAQRAALAVDNARLFAERTAAVEAVRRLNTELEQRVHARTRELEAANAELETFAYSVSHDLRAPLRSMDGFSQILLELYAGGLDERGVRYLTHVRESAQEMGQLIDALLRLSRLSRAELHRERIDLTALAASLAGHLRATDPDRTVSVDIAPNLVVEGDPTLLQAAMENLLGNAWKFTRQQESACIEVGMRLEHGIQTIYVRDNGAGFDMQYAGKLFAPFQRLHAARDYEGTGIGLATVQRIIHRHGGRIWAEGAPGQGATFFFTLGAGETGTA
jgi:light-regulated signal transduction histidine kinase (bacteriophytochrome)